MVRTLNSRLFNTPWPFIKRGAKGHRKIGPMVFEKHLWPGQNKEYPELSPNLIPRFNEGKPPLMDGHHSVQPTGYKDPNTGEFKEVSKMIPELIVPDLTNFKLKPYVSFRTDSEIRKREQKYESLLQKKGQEAADEAATEDTHWPPPKVDARLLFDLFYAERVRAAYIKREKELSSETNKLLGKKMRLPLMTSKRSLHTTFVVCRGPTTLHGWYPRDHAPRNEIPKTEEERRAAAMRYGLRPEDYKSFTPDDVRQFAGDYPDLGVVTWAHRDPYEDYSYGTFRRNWNEPVIKDYMRYRPDRYNFTGLDEDDMKPLTIIVLLSFVFVPMAIAAYYIKNATFSSYRYKNPVMPKQYPYDYHRAYPHHDPQLYPIVNYSFEPAEE